MQPYTPRSDSLAGRLCAFFRAHGDEELSSRDIGQKYDVPTNSITALLSSSLANGLLVRGKDDEGIVVYRAGPKLGQAEAPAEAAVSGFKRWLQQTGAEDAQGARRGGGFQIRTRSSSSRALPSPSPCRARKPASSPCSPA